MRHAAWHALLGEEAEELLGSRLKLLLHAGYPERAQVEAEERLRSKPDDFCTLSIAADVYKECGDLERAEALSRRFYELAQEAAGPEDLWAAGHQLSEVLRARGKTEEAEELELAVEDDEALAWQQQEEDAEAEEAAYYEPIFSAASGSAAPVQPGLRQLAGPLVKEPKIGRNQPCPCGSGKKYKKCCAA